MESMTGEQVPVVSQHSVQQSHWYLTLLALYGSPAQSAMNNWTFCLHISCGIFPTEIVVLNLQTIPHRPLLPININLCHLNRYFARKGIVIDQKSRQMLQIANAGTDCTCEVALGKLHSPQRRHVVKTIRDGATEESVIVDEEVHRDL
jgi:hypothetical protein